MWIPEVKQHYSTTPYILVGMKSDLRDQFAQHADEYRNKGWEPVSTSKAEEMKKSIGAHGYIECSAKIQYNLNTRKCLKLRSKLSSIHHHPNQFRVKQEKMDVAMSHKSMTHNSIFVSLMNRDVCIPSVSCIVVPKISPVSSINYRMVHFSGSDVHRTVVG
jgi:GTPase SAR1 family protein